MWKLGLQARQCGLPQVPFIPWWIMDCFQGFGPASFIYKDLCQQHTTNLACSSSSLLGLLSETSLDNWGSQKEKSKRRFIWNWRGQQTYRARYIGPDLCFVSGQYHPTNSNTWHSAPSEGSQLQLKGRRRYLHML